MNRHASAAELADLAAGTLRPRKAGKISGHLTGCVQCASSSEQLAGVSGLLAGVQFPPMPERLSVRLEATLAAESVQRLATEPAAESGRRDLPARAGRRRWRVPGLSMSASRLVAAAGVLVILGVGGYEVAANLGSGSPTASSGASAPLPQASRLSYGPNVTYHQDGGTKVVRVVQASTNFVRPTLGQQAVEAVGMARQNGAVPSATAAPASPSASQLSHGLPHGTSDAELAGCIGRVAAGQLVLLVEVAKFEGNAATIIVTALAQPGPGEVWVVSPGCSASNSAVLDHLKLAHI